MRRFVLFLLLLAGLAAGGVGWMLQPLEFNTETLDLAIDPGTTPRGVAQAVTDAGVHIDPTLLYWMFRLSGDARKIKAGNYELEQGVTSPWRLLQMLVRGEESLRSITLVEGWNWRQVRAALAKAEGLKPLTTNMADDLIMAELERPGALPEGRFFPDTYTYAKGSTDLALLRRALRAMELRLSSAWAQRSPGIPLQDPNQALILASIIEKETGKPADRPLIGGVFTNRLRLGMPLQTDPTVIYGLGPAFDGNLRKRDLQTDTPYNTYTRTGLPPTPIAMPGSASLLAAVQPADTRALYFVARGDGSSYFSASLDEHNRAVNKFQRRTNSAPASATGEQP